MRTQLAADLLWLLREFEVPEGLRGAAWVEDDGRVATLSKADVVSIWGRDGKLLKLSPTGLQILRYLMRQSPNLVTRDDLIRELWGEMVPNSDVLRSHLYNLRKVIDKPFDEHLLHTKPGLGFKILPPGEEF